MKNNLLDKVKPIANRTLFNIKKHSPEILIGGGIVGVIGSVILACRGTLKAKDILVQSKKDIDVIHQCEKDKSESGEYTEDDKKKDLTAVYLRTGVKLVKTYAPAIILGGLSLASIISSNNILKKRNVALVAAYTAVDQGFKSYRNNVVERFGEDVDKELRYGIKAEKIVEKIVDPETGKETEIEKNVKVFHNNSSGHSQYARFYDDGCTEWTKDPEYNLMFLRQQEQYFNDKLKADGFVFLNEVYEALGIPKSKAGQIVGWIYDPKNKDIDNYISFGIYDGYSSVARDFVNGYERTILLDFNVDGPILDKALLTL